MRSGNSEHRSVVDMKFASDLEKGLKDKNKSFEVYVLLIGTWYSDRMSNSELNFEPP